MCLLSLLSAKAQTEYIVSVDPSNCAITKIKSIPGVRWLICSSAYNETTKEYTVIGSWQPGQAPSYLYTLDAVTGNIISNPMLSAPNNFISFQYSRSTGILYALIIESGVYYLASVNKATGVCTIINNIPGINAVSGFAIDEANQRLYLNGVDNNPNFAILTIDLATGNVVSHVSSQSVFELQYNNITHKIYALRYRAGSTPFTNILSTCTIDPATGIATDIADLPGLTGVFSGYHGTINENDNLYLFLGTEDTSPGIAYLYSVSTTTGAVINKAASPSAGSPDYDNLIFFRHDNTSDTLYALLWEAHTGTLPIELNKLEATVKGRSVVCEWQTLQETNSKHFIIERSDDAVGFSSIGTVQAAGNSSIPRNYIFPDESAFLTGKENLYYRLTMVDKDGQFSFSNIVKVKMKYGAVFTISPNPVKDQLHLNLISAVNEKAVVTISDPAGRNVAKENITVTNGANSFSLNASYLPAGVYIISFNGQNRHSLKFVKTNN